MDDTYCGTQRRADSICQTAISLLVAALLAVLIVFVVAAPSQAQDAQTVTINPSEVGFGAAEITANPQTRTVTVTNNGTSDLVLAGVNFSGVAPGTFTTSIGTSGLSVGAGQSATFDIAFDPTTQGLQTATGSLVDLAGNTIPGTPQLAVTGTGVNQLPTAASNCTIVGTDRGEVLTGTPQADVICALGGADRVNGLGGNDVMQGGKDNDRITDTSGKDKLIGQSGRDTLNARDRQSGDLLKGGGKDRAIKDRRDRARSV